MLSVDVSVNGVRLHHLDIVNVGPPDGVLDNDPLGPRRYRWTQRRGTTIVAHGELIHWRCDGAQALAASVLRACACDEGELTRTRPGKRRPPKAAPR